MLLVSAAPRSFVIDRASHRRPEACNGRINRTPSHGGAIYMAAKKTAKKSTKKKGARKTAKKKR
jgi:hypothetical protein